MIIVNTDKLHVMHQRVESSVRGAWEEETSETRETIEQGDNGDNSDPDHLPPVKMQLPDSVITKLHNHDFSSLQSFSAFIEFFMSRVAHARIIFTFKHKNQQDFPWVPMI